jgi:hypothetical protein
MYFWHSTLAVHDIVGVIAHEDELPDDVLRHELDGTGLVVTEDIQSHAREVYATRNMLTIVFGDLRMCNLPIIGTVPAPAAQRDAIARAWWRFVTRHPRAYLAHRLDVFLDVIGVTFKTRSAVPPRILRHEHYRTQVGAPRHSHWFQNRWTRALAMAPLFRQWIYAVIALALALVPLFLRQRDALALLASGLLAELSLFAIGPTPDYRYSHWMITCTCIAVIMLTGRRAAWARRTADTQTAAAPHA